MKIGDQLQVTRKWGPLVPSIDYYFLRSDPRTKRVSLVIFTKQKIDHAVVLTSIDRAEFERGLIERVIVHSSTQRQLPIWLKELEGKNIPHMEIIRKDPKKSNITRTQDRFLVIARAVEDREEILSSDDPVRALNALAKDHKPRQHAGRFKLWFFTYTLFSDNIFALLPKFHNIGNWNRSVLHDDSMRCGRTSLSGEKARYHADLDMQLKISKGFAAHGDTRDTWEETYSKVICDQFRCVPIKNSLEETVYIQPESKPFPSIHQFRYWVQKSFAQQQIQETTRGSLDTKKNTGSKGRFSEGLSNIYEKVEFDGYYFKEKITALDGETPISGFCTISAVCCTSGATLGIGFARGDESYEAYLMCLFCMAIDKRKYLDLFGIDGEHVDWPCIGLPPSLITDRGPGSVMDMHQHVNWLNTLELTPAGSGQSKATVESAHRRTKIKIDSPGYFQSSHDYVRMAKKEITSACMRNHTSNVRTRMTPDMTEENFSATPHNIWVYMDDRARTSARQISFEDAVRKFLPARPVKIKSDGVWLLGFRYSSDSLSDTGIFNRAARTGVINASVYVLNMCVRHIWLDYNGELYELSAQLPIRTGPDEQYISIYKLEELDKKARIKDSATRASRPAVISLYQQIYKESTGVDMDDGKFKTGKHKRSAKIKALERQEKGMRG